jgi:hypothetical protein
MNLAGSHGALAPTPVLKEPPDSIQTMLWSYGPIREIPHEGKCGPDVT